MPTLTFAGRTLDARPDRVDLRDRPYQPRLVSLPPRYPDLPFIQKKLPQYAQDGMILDQGQEGACTGFGLAAVINYLFWIDPARWAASGARRVSPRMLYHLARFYDEWPGEDYAGSSCRGAMKGWHRHGVCEETCWPYLSQQGGWAPPRPDWEADGAHRPLGAYYRIDQSSINDMQAALTEVGAIYASAEVHQGWFARQWPLTSDGIALITVDDPAAVGGHAFAIVGYTAQGFIVQNSWGTGWGTKGFAILPYDDWVARGDDAWVAVLGAPTESTRERASMDVGAPPDGRASAFWSVARPAAVARAHPGYRPWTEREAYLRCVVMGNNCIVLNRIPEAEHGLAALGRVVAGEPAAWLDPARGRTRLVLYAHGGLNDEAASVRCARILGPYLHANDAYPIFLTWRTGVLDTLAGILEDHVQSLVPGRAGGAWNTVKEAPQDAKDRLIEAACQGLRIKAVWAQMKQNAEAAATEQQSTLAEMVAHLGALKRRVPQLELHLIGHSAGAILLGHLLDLLRTTGATGGLTVSTCTLFAPACTVDFALEHYARALGSVLPGPGAVDIHVLTDERERADAVGPYGKSLLYLISRGLENHHKTPVLGLAGVWDPPRPDQWGSPRLARQVADWRAAWSPGVAVTRGAQGDSSDGVQSAPWLHGTFDKDTAVITQTIERITGRKVVAPVENLSGY